MNRTWFAAIFLLLGSSFFLSAGAAQSTLKKRVLKAPAHALARSYLTAKEMTEKIIPLGEQGFKIIVPAGTTQSILTGSAVKAPALLKERAMKAPAYVLARSYFTAKQMIENIIPLVGRGITIILPDGKLTKRKARKYKKEYGKRLSIYAEAITERGYKTIAGSYQARTSESCGRIRSSWVGLIHGSPPSGVEIQQDGYGGQLTPWFEHEGKETMRNNLVMVIKGKEILRENLVIVVENIVMVHDDGNEDYFYRGEIKGKNIVIKPGLSVLAGWPKWAGPPLEQDLRECTITLEPRTGNPGG